MNQLLANQFRAQDAASDLSTLLAPSPTCAQQTTLCFGDLLASAHDVDALRRASIKAPDAADVAAQALVPISDPSAMQTAFVASGPMPAARMADAAMARLIGGARPRPIPDPSTPVGLPPTWLNSELPRASVASTAVTGFTGGARGAGHEPGIAVVPSATPGRQTAAALQTEGSASVTPWGISDLPVRSVDPASLPQQVPQSTGATDSSAAIPAATGATNGPAGSAEPRLAPQSGDQSPGVASPAGVNTTPTGPGGALPGQPAAVDTDAPGTRPQKNDAPAPPSLGRNAHRADPVAPTQVKTTEFMPGTARAQDAPQSAHVANHGQQITTQAQQIASRGRQIATDAGIAEEPPGIQTSEVASALGRAGQNAPTAQPSAPIPSASAAERSAAAAPVAENAILQGAQVPPADVSTTSPELRGASQGATEGQSRETPATGLLPGGSDPAATDQRATAPADLRPTARPTDVTEQTSVPQRTTPEPRRLGAPQQMQPGGPDQFLQGAGAQVTTAAAQPQPSRSLTQALVPTAPGSFQQQAAQPTVNGPQAADAVDLASLADTNVIEAGAAGPTRSIEASPPGAAQVASEQVLVASFSRQTALRRPHGEPARPVANNATDARDAGVNGPTQISVSQASPPRVGNMLSDPLTSQSRGQPADLSSVDTMPPAAAGAAGQPPHRGEPTALGTAVQSNSRATSPLAASTSPTSGESMGEQGADNAPDSATRAILASAAQSSPAGPAVELDPVARGEQAAPNHTQALVNQISRATAVDTGVVQLDLQWEDVGIRRMVLTVDEGRVRVELACSSADAAAAVRALEGPVRERLESQGIQLSEFQAQHDSGGHRESPAQEPAPPPGDERAERLPVQTAQRPNGAQAAADPRPTGTRQGGHVDIFI